MIQFNYVEYNYNILLSTLNILTKKKWNEIAEKHDFYIMNSMEKCVKLFHNFFICIFM